jgi:hypothetical protein
MALKDYWQAYKQYRQNSKSNSVEIEAAREIVKTMGVARGFVINSSKWLNEVYKNFQIEHDRMTIYKDVWTMIKETPLVDKSGEAIIQDATSEPFRFICESSRAKKIADELMNRIKYWYLRPQFLKRGTLLGDDFLKLDYEKSYRGIGQIAQIRLLPEFTMYRMSNFMDYFPNPQIAFIQKTSPSNFQYFDIIYYIGDNINFSLFEIIHARYNMYNQLNPKYGTSALESSRKQYNLVMMMLQDMAVGRKMATFNRIHHDVDQAVSDDKFKEYKKDREDNPPDVATEYVTSGVKITAVDAQNRLMEHIDDLRLAIDILKIGLGYPLEFFGYGNEAVSGDQLAKIEMRLKRSIAYIHLYEEWEILRPLFDMEFFLHGMNNVEYEIDMPPISFEDENKISKREISKVQAGTKSRRTAAMQMENWTMERAEEELDQCEKELKELGQIQKYQAPGESLNKGKKGVEKLGPEGQDISDTEGMTDEE